ncbi:MAG: hypothetical protein KC416_16990, partial [Myxococcales bacterium]|nr:hypothetical protein [Myxococcales bacterium]
MSPIQATATHHGFPAVLLAIALGGVLGGCDALASDATVGSESPADGGAFGGDRADGGVGVSSPEVDNADGLAFGSCLDAQDNNQDGLTDCEDESCNMAGVCCIDNARCCTVTDSSMVDFGTLTDFGQPSPTVQDGTFFPGGDGTFDSGATLGTTYDLRAEQVLLEATIKPADCADSTCLEVLGIAIVPGPITGNETLVNPTVGLLYRGAYNTVALLLGGTIVNEWTLPNKTTGSRWTLELSPTGQVEVGNGDGSAGYTTTFAPLGGARVALYGRNEDGSAMGAGAGLQALTVTRKTCDTPFQWQSRGELDLVDGNSPAELGSLRGPSVAVGGQGEVRVAFEHEGAILLGTK